MHPDCFDSQLLLLSSLRLCFRQQQPVCRQLNQGGLPPAGTQHNGDESGRTCPQAASSASAALLCCNMPVSCQVVCCSLAAGTDWVTCWYIAGAVVVRRLGPSSPPFLPYRDPHAFDPGPYPPTLHACPTSAHLNVPPPQRSVNFRMRGSGASSEDPWGLARGPTHAAPI